MNGAMLGWALLIALCAFLLGFVGCYLTISRHFSTVNFWVGFMRTSSRRRRLDVQMAFLAAELIVDPPPSESNR